MFSLFLLFCPMLAWSDADEITIPDKFDSVSTSAADAYVFAGKCMPSVTEASFGRTIKDIGTNASAVTRSPDRQKPFLAINSTRTICVQMSSKQYPILPAEIFDETIGFDGLSAEDTKALRVSLARQLALGGAASALVKNEKGNASAVYYMFVSDTPDKLYYHMAFLKAGEFDESKYPIVVQHTGAMSTVARGQRGQPPETYKYMFQK
jgi:hypothetical protein